MRAVRPIDPAGLVELVWGRRLLRDQGYDPRQAQIDCPIMSDEIHFAGDPATESARRHLERVLKSPPRRRGPWVAAFLASGTAVAIWRHRQRRQNGHAAPESGYSSK